MKSSLERAIEWFYSEKVYITKIDSGEAYIKVDYYNEKTLYPNSKRIIHIDIEKRIVCKFDTSIRYSQFTYDESVFYRDHGYTLCSNSKETETEIYSISDKKIEFYLYELSAVRSKYNKELMLHYFNDENIFMPKNLPAKEACTSFGKKFREILMSNNYYNDTFTIKASEVAPSTFNEIYNGESMSSKQTILKICRNLKLHDTERDMLLLLSGNGRPIEDIFKANQFVKDFWEKDRKQITTTKLLSGSSVSGSTLDNIKKTTHETRYTSLLKISVALIMDSDRITKIIKYSGHDPKYNYFNALLLAVVDEGLKEFKVVDVLNNYIYNVNEYKFKLERTLVYHLRRDPYYIKKGYILFYK